MGIARFALRLLREPVLRRRLVLGVVVFGLTFLPLLGTLGYENAFVLSPIFAVLAVGVGVDAVHRDRGAGLELGKLALPVGRELALLHVIAVGLLLVGRLWQRGCDPLGGLTFYAMGPVISSLLGAVAGLWGGLLVIRRRRALLLGMVPMLFCTVIGLWRLYAEPVVYAFDPFFGYFSGSVYDESVSVTERYVRFRAYNGLVALAAILGWLEVARRKAESTATVTAGVIARRVVAGLATVGSLAIGLQAADYGFTADDASLAEVLSLTHETEHFVIHYTPRSPEARTIEVVAAEHEFAWARLRAQMGREPDQKVHSFMFANSDQKRSLMGAGKVQVAAPWRYHIYLDHRGFPHPVLHHELAHVFGNTIGDDIFGVARSGLRLNIGLIEGFATAMGPRAADRLDLHDQVVVLTALKRRPPLAEIMGPGFFSRSSRVAYTTAGSFCRWLIDTRGFEGMAVLYLSAGDFESAYGESLADLEAEWLAFIDQREGVRPEDIQAQALRFKRRSVFQRPCAHKVAEVRREIGRAQRRGKFEEAVEGFSALCELEPENPAHKLGLAFGLAEARDIERARATLDSADAMDDLTVTTLSAIAQRRGDIEMFEGNLAAAAAAYDAALALPTWEESRRSLTLKRLGARTPALAPLLVRYFGLFDIEGDGLRAAVNRLQIAFAIAEVEGHQALGEYLIGRQLINVQETEAAIEHLDRALANPDQLPDADFLRAARKERMSAAVIVGDYDEAESRLAQLESDPAIGNGHRLDYAYWHERIEFFRSYRP